MNGTRHQAREIALQILYGYEVEAPSAEHQAPKLTAELESHFGHFAVAADIRPFIARLVSGTLLSRSGLDAYLEKHAANWKVSRMALVDRCLLRMAIYEMTEMPETPKAVIIDEAIELAKQFGTADTPAFVNGVLDSIQKSALSA